MMTETVFAVSLEEHLKENGREISSVIEECCSVMTQLGTKREGLLYASGNANRVKQIRTALNNRNAINWNDYADDIHRFIIRDGVDCAQCVVRSASCVVRSA